MSVTKFMLGLLERGIMLWSDGNDLNLRAPAQTISPSLRAEISKYKLEIIDLIDQGQKYVICSFAQQRLWFLDHLRRDSSIYNNAFSVKLTGPLHLPGLAQSIHEIIRRHEPLRTSFTSLEGYPVQIIHQMFNLPLSVIDLSQEVKTSQESEVHQIILEQMRLPFSLTQYPLIRVVLIKLNEEEHVLHLTIHHMITDGWSVGILEHELVEYYQFFTYAKPLSLPEITTQYSHFTVKQRIQLKERKEQLLNYWRSQFQDAPLALKLPTDRPRPNGDISQGTTETFSVSKVLTEELNRLARRSGATMFMVLLAALYTLLYRYSNQENIIVGTDVMDRPDSSTESLIGCFINTLALWGDLTRNPTFSELLRRVQGTTREAYSNRDLPFEMLVPDLHMSRDLINTPLFQVFFVLLDDLNQHQEIPGLSIERIQIERNVALFDLCFLVTNTGEGLKGVLQYSTDLFDYATIVRMLANLQTLLMGIVTNPDQSVQTLPLLTEAERQQVFIEWNNTKTTENVGLLHSFFEHEASLHPDVLAVVSPAKSLTYRELQQASFKVGHWLHAQGAQPNTLVAVVMEKGWEQVVSVLGILYAGAAYLPIDPAQPKERIWHLLKQGEVRFVLTQPRVDQNIEWPENLQKLCIETTALSALWLQNLPLPPVQTVSDLAYVIYTSGSTGVPKGVMIDHEGAVNTIWDINQRFNVEPRDRILALSSLSFDLSVYDVFGLLGAGGGVILPDAAYLHDPAHWAEVIIREKVTIWNSVPALFQLYTDYLSHHPNMIPQTLRLVLLSGDWIPVDLPDQFRSLVPNVQMISLGGATEASIWSILYPIEKVEPHWVRIPYGRPMNNQLFYIFNEALEPCPVNVTGDIYIGGKGLALGYWKDDQKTNESFLIHPRTRERLYRTGDRGRYWADGTIEFLGRIDNQVKIHGYRIELGEIDAVLHQQEAVRQAIVVTRPDSHNVPRLIAYVVPKQGHSIVPDMIEEFLKTRLPNYMIPARIVIVDTLPLSLNGKVNCAALPSSEEAGSGQHNEFVSPCSPIEQGLANIWQDIIGTEDIGVHDNFFDLGGDSLATIQLALRVRDTFQVEVPLPKVFEIPTIAELASFIEEAILEKVQQMNDEEAQQLLLWLQEAEGY